MRPALALIVTSLLVGTARAEPVRAEPVTGRASVIDGDTIDVQGRRIRLHGVDAPESGQRCRRAFGLVEYRCGKEAAFALADRIGARNVSCEVRDVDRYKRLVAVCRDGDQDLNGWMVRQGWALAYVRFSRDYEGEEQEAREERRGVWRGAFVPPWEWRRGTR